MGRGWYVWAMAPKHLRAWLQRNGRTAAWLARELGMARSSVSLWLSGDRVPEGWTRDRIALLTGVAADAWETAEARRRRERARREAARASREVRG